MAKNPSQKTTSCLSKNSFFLPEIFYSVEEVKVFCAGSVL
jgi:hypothetical protein